MKRFHTRETIIIERHIIWVIFFCLQKLEWGGAEGGREGSLEQRYIGKIGDSENYINMLSIEYNENEKLPL